MDANGTRYHLLLGQDDWASCSEDGVLLSDRWGGAGGSDLLWNPTRQDLTLRAQLFLFPPSASDVPHQPQDRRGAAQDRYGNWYWIDPASQSVLVRWSEDTAPSGYWPAADRVTAAAPAGAFGPRAPQPAAVPASFAGLAITEHHYLVVGTVDPAGLLVFDLHAGGPPHVLLWPAGVPFVPFDLSPAPGGGVWVLDRVNHRYWGLDGHFTVLSREQTMSTLAPQHTADFQPLDKSSVRTTPAVTFPQGITVGAAFPVGAVDPIAIEGLPDGTVLILDRQPDPTQPFSVIERYRFADLQGAVCSLASFGTLVEDAKQAGFALIGHDLAFVPAPRRAGSPPCAAGLLYVAGTGDQSFVLSATTPAGGGPLTLTPLATYLPMRRFGGKGLEVGGGGVPQYDFADTWLPLIEQRRPRYLPDATITTRVFDGRDPDCVWHRLFVDMVLPDETSVQVSSRAANELTDLALGAWSAEPLQLRQRTDGSEIPFAQVVDGHTTWDLLFQSARGRYLQLKLQLHGNLRASPRLRALRAYYPRFSYSAYLPTAYRDSDVSGFVERFLANPEGFFTAIEGRIASVQVLFDAAGVPPDATDWLISWFGIVADPTWEDFRRRLLLRHAMDLFQYRGTSRGLQMALQLLLSASPDDSIFLANQDQVPGGIRIIERYATRRTPAALLGDPTGAEGILLNNVPALAWTPAQGGPALLKAYAQALQATPAPTAFPIAPPSDAATAAVWGAFTLKALGFVPVAPDAQDPVAWTGFLLRRYRRVSALNTAYKATFASFESVPMPTSVPPDGAALADWFQFEGVVKLMRRAAHRFTVMLPVPTAEIGDDVAQQTRRSLAQRLIDLEKPAHTLYDVKFYWVMFRIGQARLGIDTTVDRGSRAPELMPAMVLGQGYLSESHLAPVPPQSATDRTILGRDRLEKGRPRAGRERQS